MPAKLSGPSNRKKPNSGSRRATKLSNQSVLKRAAALRRAHRLGARYLHRLEVQELQINLTLKRLAALKPREEIVVASDAEELVAEAEASDEPTPAV